MELNCELYERLVQVLANQIFSYTSDDDLVKLWNRYCEEEGDEEYIIHEMWEVDEVLNDCTPSEVLDCLGNFDKNDSYFTYDGELNTYEDVWCVMDAGYRDETNLAEWVLDNEVVDGVPELVEFWEDVRNGNYNEEGDEDDE